MIKLYNITLTDYPLFSSFLNLLCLPLHQKIQEIGVREYVPQVLRCLEQIFGYNIPKEDRKDIWTQNIYKILVETIQNLSREKGLSTLRNNLYNKRNSLERLLNAHYLLDTIFDL